MGCFLIPESPRWLCSHGRIDEATKILAKYHGAGDVNHPVVQLELQEFQESISVQKGRAWWDWRQLVHTHSARWRLLMVLLMSYGSQLSGNSVLTYYLPSMYTQLGIVSTDRRLLLTFVNSIVSCAGALAGSATNDWIGRRTKLWVGSILLAGIFSAVTGFSSQFTSKAAAAGAGVALSNAGVAMVRIIPFFFFFFNFSLHNTQNSFSPSLLKWKEKRRTKHYSHQKLITSLSSSSIQIFLFGCVYSFIYTPLTATYCAESLDNHTRATGMGIVSMIIPPTQLIPILLFSFSFSFSFSFFFNTELD